jgi:Na+/glutamate symporter
MKKSVLTFGLISGVIISVLMGGSMLIAYKLGASQGGHNGMLLGYTMMVASFLLVYFGIRSYRDNVLAGHITFGRAFSCGILISLISCVCYVVTWEIIYFNFMPHFMDSYWADAIHKAQTSGQSAAAVATQVAALQHQAQSYQNPLYNAAMTFMEPFPVGLLITLISAFVLRRKSPATTISATDPALT